MNISENILELMKYEQNVNITKYKHENYIWNPCNRRISAIDKDYKYSPESHEWFKLKSYWVPIENMEVEKYYTDSNKYLLDYLIQNNKVLFIVHPICENLYTDFEKYEKGPSLNAFATSSTRTVLVYPDDNPKLLFFAKLSLDKKNFDKLVSRDETFFSIISSQLFESGKTFLPKNFKYFPEILGIFPKTEKNRKIGGMIIRQIPSELLKSEINLMPMFALYTRQKNGKIPIISMIEKSQLNNLNWIQKYLITPFTIQFLELQINNGIITESHGQNLLIQINDYEIINFYYRDLDGVEFDLEYREKIGISTPENVKEYWKICTYDEHLTESHIYFLFILAAIAKTLNISPYILSDMFIKTLQSEFLKYCPEIFIIDSKYKNFMTIIKTIQNYIINL